MIFRRKKKELKNLNSLKRFKLYYEEIPFRVRGKKFINKKRPKKKKS